MRKDIEDKLQVDYNISLVISVVLVILFLFSLLVF